MEHSLDRRQMLKVGAGLVVGVGAASLFTTAQADASPMKPAVKQPVGSIAVERLWGATRRHGVRVLNTKGVWEGTDTPTLNRGGLCHWIGTAKPQTLGNCVLFGHRTAAGGPLRRSEILAPGDAIYLRIGNTTQKFVVSEPPSVIGSRDFAKAINWGDPSKVNLTLVACTKLNKRPTSTAFRLLVRAVAA